MCDQGLEGKQTQTEAVAYLHLPTKQKIKSP